jgi:hypothetical protein
MRNQYSYETVPIPKYSSPTIIHTTVAHYSTKGFKLVLFVENYIYHTNDPVDSSKMNENVCHLLIFEFTHVLDV